MPSEPRPQDLLEEVYRRAAGIQRRARRRRMGLAVLVVACVAALPLVVTSILDDGEGDVLSTDETIASDPTTSLTTSTDASTTTEPAPTTAPAVGPPATFVALVDDRLAVVSTDAGEVIRYLTPPGRAAATSVTMTADGRWVYFSRPSGQGCAQDVLRVPTAGGDEEAIAVAPGLGHVSVAVSGDGSWLAFHEFRCDADLAEPERDWLVVRHLPSGQEHRHLTDYESSFPGAQALDDTGGRVISGSLEHWTIVDAATGRGPTVDTTDSCYTGVGAWLDDATVVLSQDTGCDEEPPVRVTVLRFVDAATGEQVRAPLELPPGVSSMQALDPSGRYALGSAHPATGTPRTVVVDLDQGTVVRELATLFPLVIW